MSNIFNLTRIAQIAQSQRLACVLVVDTNVLMEEPDPANWMVTVGPALFVLSDMITQELEHIRQRKESGKKEESREKAEKAITSLTNLIKKGRITEGININAGWIIGIPSPKHDELELELKKYDEILQAFRRSDTKLLLLTKECNQSIASTPVIMVTRDANLFNEAQMNDIPCHLFAKFPIEGLQEVIERSRLKTVDWDQVLEEVESLVKQKAVAIEVTLTSQRCAPSWLMTHNKSLVIAEGHGVMRDSTKNRSFLWTIPFESLAALTSISESSEKSVPDLPTIYLDFLDGDDIEQELFDDIADRLLECTHIDFSHEEHPPTLQNPKSVMVELLEGM